MEKIKVSVIIPVYNGEAFLAECMDSVIGQTLQEIEIIVVDDGSTDSTNQILENYSKQDERITILHQENQYAGTARNYGMSIAKGEYLVFWDADDYFESTALECMYKQAVKDHAQICVCGVNHFSMDSQKLSPANNYVKKKMLPDNRPFNREDIPGYIMNFATAHPWNKLFEKKFVDESGIKFHTTRNGNDLFFTQNLICMAQRITVVEKHLINYRVDQKGSLFGGLTKAPLTPIYNWVATRESLIEHGVYPEQSFFNKILGTLVYFLRNITEWKAFEETVEYLQKEGCEKLGIREQDEDYYYVSWHRGFVEALLHQTPQDVLMYLAGQSYRQVKAKGGTVARNKVRDKERKETIKKLKAELNAQSKELEEIKKTLFYRAGRKLGRMPK
ncbi:glycosyltransferase family 2 protein [Eubacterium oxidoreducens]|uniref:Glycosyl transferase family 2 n=1 Tax=Eubacterium oxidoreducens TaxID=1732 RepID=A0A1G6CNN4_EUBOX|nr:glycosyltransferase family 2 protein [Eubacterium oxidoreducens]SDB34507.1 Glycosyl transferase family 2 [Eubacterium oxidoreducens]